MIDGRKLIIQTAQHIQTSIFHSQLHVKRKKNCQPLKTADYGVFFEKFYCENCFICVNDEYIMYVIGVHFESYDSVFVLFN